MAYLIAAILFEVAGTAFMKASSGFTHITPSVLIFISYGLCCVFFTLALRTIETGTAYAIGSGGGTLLIALIGVVCFNETATSIKIAGTIFTVVGVVMLVAKA